MTGPSDTIAVLAPSPPRRWLALAMLWTLGAICLWLAVSSPPSDLVWLVALAVLGAGSLALGEALRRATRGRLSLTERGLEDGAGRVLAPMEAIRSVDRGVFAFKPSNGFVLRLDRRLGGAWAPGLWWRLGRRVGVGGVTPGPQSRFMAEALTAALAERSRGN